jgi:hypothetical protein
MDVRVKQEILFLTGLVEELYPNETLELYIHKGKCLRWEKKKRWIGYFSLGVSTLFLSPSVMVIMDNSPTSYNVIDKLKRNVQAGGKHVRWTIDYLQEEQDVDSWWRMESWNFMDVTSLLPFRTFEFSEEETCSLARYDFLLPPSD